MSMSMSMPVQAPDSGQCLLRIHFQCHPMPASDNTYKISNIANSCIHCHNSCPGTSHRKSASNQKQVIFLTLLGIITQRKVS